ncbi:MAG: hypothetical protein FK733_06760 [Asgard group archaeon]|nr:hypothetical protein [Asgard group archaeon]
MLEPLENHIQRLMKVILRNYGIFSLVVVYYVQVYLKKKQNRLSLKQINLNPLQNHNKVIIMTFLEVYSILVPSITFVALLYAGIEDLLYREVRREIIWLLMIGIGVILDVLYLVLYTGTRAKTEVLAEMLLTIVISFIIGFVLFYIGAWGGADSKALWSLSILTPLHPFYETQIGTLLNINIDYIWVLDSSIISILLNSGLIAVFYPIVLICINAITATRGPLYDEVEGSTTQKIRSFVFGFKKKVAKINPNKLHFDFLEDLPDRTFSGSFTGNFDGELDGKFIGLFEGKFSGEFTGDIFGKFLLDSEFPFNEEEIDSIVKEAEKLSKELNLLSEFDKDEEIDLQLLKYREKFSTDEPTSKQDDDKALNLIGKYTGPFEGRFIGSIEGIFHGTFEGKVLGKLEGDFKGKSPKGKLSGTSTKQEHVWQLKIRAGLDEDTVMEKRQLRTLWKLQNSEKKTVWVTPGIPFVFLMLLGYILYIFIGNFALYLFRL